MDGMMTGLGRALLAVGLTWIAQTSGLTTSGLLACSPSLFVAGAAIAGIGAGLLAWTAVDAATPVAIAEPTPLAA